MARYLDENSNLTICLLSFNKPNKLTESFYFLEMSTMQATKLLPSDRKVVYSKIFAHTVDDKYLDKQIAESFKTIGDFNAFFSDNPDYHIHDCEIELENGIIINSHDDGQVSVQYSNDNSDQIITKIFEKYNLNRKIIDVLKSEPGHYLAIDNESNVIADYENFDDYITHGRG